MSNSIATEKQRIIDYYVKKTLVIDKLKPDITSFDNITSEQIRLIHLADDMRMKLYNEIKNHKYFKEIEQAYLIKIKN